MLNYPHFSQFLGKVRIISQFGTPKILTRPKMLPETSIDFDDWPKIFGPKTRQTHKHF